MKNPLMISAFLVLICSGVATADEGKTVSDLWYTVSVNKIPSEYYNEKVVSHGDNIQFLSHVWKKEEGYINEELLGAFSKADQDLTPLFFNFRSTYRASETVVDGNVRDGKTLVANIRKDGQKLPTVTRSVTPRTFFSVFFPVWLRKVVPSLKVGKTVSFSTILEDDVEHGFESESGVIHLEKPDAFAQETGTQKISVDYRSVRSFWWVEKTGLPLRTLMPESNVVIDRSTKEKAQAFLK